jgi:hypothetical protein
VERELFRVPTPLSRGIDSVFTRSLIEL